MRNADAATVRGFGDEWGHFDQREAPPEENAEYFDKYFALFPWDKIGKDSIGFDAGCGTGRWARLVAPRVKTIHCVDASEVALGVAKRNLAECPNAVFHNSSLAEMPFPDGSMDFGYSLGVLHHIPDTIAGIEACARKLKPGAPLLLYIYYAFDNRPAWFRKVWQVSDAARRVVSRFPFPARYAVSQTMAYSVYWPLARLSRGLEKLGMDVDALPLSAYRHRSFYGMRTDSLDRFGTRLEHRFTKEQIRTAMEGAGLERIRFSDEMPYWCGIGYRKG